MDWLCSANTNLLPTNGIRQGNICRNEIVNNPKRNHTSAERDMKYHSQNYYLQPNPVSLQLMTSFESKRHCDCFLPHRHKITWNGSCTEETDYLHLECLLKMQTVNSSETLLPRPRYPNLNHMMFIHHCENLKQKTQWMVHAGKTELQVPHYVLNQHWCMLLQLAHLHYSFYCLVKWTKT
jgi:hypothetical protein